MMLMLIMMMMMISSSMVLTNGSFAELFDASKESQHGRCASLLFCLFAFGANINKSLSIGNGRYDVDFDNIVSKMQLIERVTEDYSRLKSL